MGVEFAVKLEEALEFLYGFFVVVDADVDVAVHEAGVAAVFADDEEGGGLLAAFVASGLLSGLEGGEEPFGEFTITMAAGVFKGLGHGVDDTLAGEDVAGDGVVFAGFVASKVEALFTGVGGNVAFLINDEKLPAGDAGVLFGEECFDFFGSGSVFEEL